MAAWILHGKQGMTYSDRSEHHPHQERSCIKSEGKSVWPVGDLFTLGRKTYFWNPTLGRFDGILTTD
jgi:hypothetical protein